MWYDNPPATKVVEAMAGWSTPEPTGTFCPDCAAQGAKSPIMSGHKLDNPNATFSRCQRCRYDAKRGPTLTQEAVDAKLGTPAQAPRPTPQKPTPQKNVWEEGSDPSAKPSPQIPENVPHGFCPWCAKKGVVSAIGEFTNRATKEKFQSCPNWKSGCKYKPRQGADAPLSAEQVSTVMSGGSVEAPKPVEKPKEKPKEKPEPESKPMRPSVSSDEADDGGEVIDVRSKASARFDQGQGSIVQGTIRIMSESERGNIPVDAAVMSAGTESVRDQVLMAA